MRILLTGAQGFLGRHLLAALNERGHQVVACARQIPQESKRTSVQWQQVEFGKHRSAKAWLPYLQDIDVVINTVGIIRECGGQSFKVIHEQAPKALFDACEQAGVGRLVHVSALGAELNADTEFLRSKARADADLRQRTMDWVLFKPSLIFGPGGASFERLQRLAAWPLWPLLDGGTQQLQPIDIDDAVRAIIQIVECKWPVRKTYELVGPKALSLFEILQHFRQAQGHNRRTARLITLPFAPVHRLWRWTDTLLKPFKKPFANADILLMLQRGNHANAQAMVQHFGFMPKSLAASLSANTQRHAHNQWQQQRQWQQRFALLRYSLAMLWLWTAWVSVAEFPLAESGHWLGTMGIPDAWQTPLTVMAAALDALIGVALWLNYQPRCTLKFSLQLMLLYSVLLTLFLPELWLHPFGPISKNIPLFAASFLLLHWQHNARHSAASYTEVKPCISR